MKYDMFSTRLRWITFGVLSSLGYGFWAFFDKLSISQSPFIANFIVYGTALALAAAIPVKLRGGPTITIITSGIFGGIINLLVLIALVDHLLIAVYPFVAAGTLIHFAITYLVRRPAYKRVQLYGVSAGIALAFIGLSISGLALDYNGFSSPDVSLLVICIFITIASGLWIYFASRAIIDENSDPRTVGFWSLLSSFAVSAVGMALMSRTNEFLPSLDLLFPFLAGVFEFIGLFFACYAFSAIRDNPSVARSSTVAILANSEIVPIVFLSFIVLGEFHVGGFIGIAILAIGLFLLNHIEARL
jgi:hypothetical protein